MPYGAEPGPWRNDRAPYTVAIMDAYSDPAVEQITICGPAQCGKTEAVFNMLHYTIDTDPVPSMYVIAIDDEIEDISTERILKNLRHSPQLASHLTERAWDTKANLFRLDRMPLYFTGAGSASKLASKPIGRLFLDETDKYADAVGAEGHPAKLAERRGTTYGDFKVVYLCTPTTPHGFISVSWRKSNRQHYHVPCLRCGHWQVLQFGRLKCYDAAATDKDAILSAGSYYACPVCDGAIDSSDQSSLIARGRWVPDGQQVGDDGQLTGTPRRSKRHCGFWITELLSPWLDWTKILAEWHEIQAAGLEKQGMEKEFTNQVLGAPFVEKGQQIDREQAHRKVVSLPPRAVPTTATVLVAAADYHRGLHGNERVDWGVFAVSPGFKVHLVLAGSSPSLDDFGGAVLTAPFAWAGETTDQELCVTTAFVDSGHEPDIVYQWCRQYRGVCWPIKGEYNRRDPLRRKPLDEVLEKAVDPRRKKLSKYFKGMDLVEIYVDYFKDVAANLLGDSDGQSRSMTFYDQTPEWFLKEITNEHKVRIRKGRSYSYTWQPVTPGAAVHGLDVLVYGLAALYFNKADQATGRPEPAQMPAALRRQQTRRRVKLSEKPRRRL